MMNEASGIRLISMLREISRDDSGNRFDGHIPDHRLWRMAIRAEDDSEAGACEEHLRECSQCTKRLGWIVFAIENEAADSSSVDKPAQVEQVMSRIREMSASRTRVRESGWGVKWIRMARSRKAILIASMAATLLITLRIAVQSDSVPVHLTVIQSSSIDRGAVGEGAEFRDLGLKLRLEGTDVWNLYIACSFRAKNGLVTVASFPVDLEDWPANPIRFSEWDNELVLPPKEAVEDFFPYVSSGPGFLIWGIRSEHDPLSERSWEALLEDVRQIFSERGLVEPAFDSAEIAFESQLQSVGSTVLEQPD